MLKFYYNPAYKYTNRVILDVTNDSNYTSHDYENIDSPDTINGHIIYTLSSAENIPTYVVDDTSGWRWFVSGITQLRTGKFQLSLLRDIISESPNTWKQEQAYITAGFASNYNKYKRWGLPYTNTKIKQERLNFGGKSSFFVFYVNQQQQSSSIISEDNLTIKYTSIPGVSSIDYEISDLEEIQNYQYLNAGVVHCWPTSNRKSTLKAVFAGGPQDLAIDLGDQTVYTLNPTSNRFNNISGNIPVENILTNVNNCKTYLLTAISDYSITYRNSLGSSITENAVNSLAPYVGKYVLNTTTNKVYLITDEPETIIHNDLLSPTTLYTALTNIVWGSNTNFSSKTGNWFVFQNTEIKHNYKMTEVGVATSLDFTFSAGVRKLPKSAVRCVNIVSDSNHTDEEITQCLMMAQTNGLNVDNTTGRILDIQYLPFSLATETNSDFKINNNDLTARYLEQDDFIFNTNLSDLTNINKETDTIKIVSPSRASQYLFRPYDNEGVMEFLTKATIRPYTSTIYIRPSTQGLLLVDWDDKDCLIIEEDFSLTNVTSEWTQYIYNNRNYLNTFERQIQGREFGRSWERRVEEAQKKSDDWSARLISAQKAQTYTGNIPIISGIAAAFATGVQDQIYMEQAQLDRQYNEALYQEGMSLSRDLFEYQLDNIKSQPLIPSKVTTIDCKFLDGVYLEYYSTNETELDAIANFYKYNGNRIDDYGTFSSYWGSVVKGKIIISKNYTQPEIDELNRRLSMGIFTGGLPV